MEANNDIKIEELPIGLYNDYLSLTQDVSERLAHNYSSKAAELRGAGAIIRPMVDAMNANPQIESLLGNLDIHSARDKFLDLQQEIESGLPDPATVTALTAVTNALRLNKEEELQRTQQLQAPIFEDPHAYRRREYGYGAPALAA